MTSYYFYFIEKDTYTYYIQTKLLNITKINVNIMTLNISVSSVEYINSN